MKNIITSQIILERKKNKLFSKKMRYSVKLVQGQSRHRESKAESEIWVLIILKCII